MCGPAVLCGTCGNNTCNAGRGELPNGDPCPDCDSADKMCHEFYESNLGQLYLKHIGDLTSRWCAERNYAQEMEMYLAAHHPEVLADVRASMMTPKPKDPFDPFASPDEPSAATDNPT